MGFSYFYRNQSERFAFVQIPRTIMTGDEFAMLSVEAKVLYGLLLDTMCRSINNQWVDEKNREFIVYPITKIMDELRISKSKAVDCLHELERIGLIDKRNRGQGQPSYIYVKDFWTDSQEKS